MNTIIQKRIFLINNIDWVLDLLAYHKAWADKIRESKSVVLWTWDESESGCDVNAVA